MAVRITLAGQVGVECNGTLAGAAGLGRLGRVALAYLVGERHRPVPRDQLAAALWGEDLPPTWEAAVRGTVQRLRAALTAAGLPGAEVLTTAYGCYQVHLPVSVTVDVEEAAADIAAAESLLERGQPAAAETHAAAAAAVASRQFLPGFAGLWVEQRQAELRALQLRALDIACRAAGDAGHWASAVAAAEELLVLDPFREATYVSLMDAHAAAGNRAEALRAYERCRKTLAVELGIDPSPATEAAYLDLLGAEPVPAVTSAAPDRDPLAPAEAAHVTPVAPAGVPPTRSGANGPDPAERTALLPLPGPLAARRSPFVGRADALERLHAQLDAARRGGVEVALVVGEPGIGKTRVVAEFARGAHDRGATVLYGRCDDEALVPYQPFIEVLRSIAVHAPPAVVAGALGASGPAVLHVAPELAPSASATDHGDAVADATGSGERYRLFEGIAGFIAALSRSAPVVLALEDLHWADAPTLLLLRHLVRWPEPAAVLVVATYRDTELTPDHALTQTLADLRRERPLERIPLDGFDEPEVESFLDGSGWSDRPADLGRVVLDSTEGNPFFVEEILRHLAESGWTGGPLPAGLPQGVRDLITRRLGRLPGAARDVLSVAAVIGRDFDLALVRAAGPDIDADDALTVLDAAVRARMVVEAGEPGSYSFSHALVRDALYAELSVARRAELHTRVGTAVLDRDPGLAAHHLLQAHPTGDTARQACEAGGRAAAAAAAAMAHEDAAVRYEAALVAAGRIDDDAEADRIRFELLVGLGHARRRAGLTVGAREAFVDAAEIARRRGDGAGFAAAALGFADIVADRTYVDDGVGAALLEDALAMNPDAGEALRARLLASLAAEYPHRPLPKYRRKLELSESAVDAARSSEDPATLQAALVARHWVLLGSPAVDERLAIATEALELAEQAGDPEGAIWCRNMRVYDLTILGEVAGVDAEIAQVADVADALRQPALRWLPALWAVMRALQDGRFDDAERLARRALDIGERAHGASALRQYGAQLILLERARGRLDAARALVAQGLADRPTALNWRAAGALFDIEAGDDAARARIRELVGELVHTPPNDAWVSALCLLAEACAVAGDEVAAEAVYRELLAHERNFVLVSGYASASLGCAARYLGLLATAMGAWSEAEGHFAIATARHLAVGARAWQADTDADRARLYLRRARPGDRARAESLLATARATAAQLGMARPS